MRVVLTDPAPGCQTGAEQPDLRRAGTPSHAVPPKGVAGGRKSPPCAPGPEAGSCGPAAPTEGTPAGGWAETRSRCRGGKGAPDPKAQDALLGVRAASTARRGPGFSAEEFAEPPGPGP